MSGKKVIHQTSWNMARLHLANKTTSCLSFVPGWSSDSNICGSAGDSAEHTKEEAPRDRDATETSRDRLRDLPERLEEVTKKWWTPDLHPQEVTEQILQNHLVRSLFISTDQRRSTNYLHIFPCNQIARFASEPKLQEPPAHEIPKAACPARPSSVTLSQPTTRSSTKKENRGTIRGMQIVVQDLATQWIQSYLCKTKTSPETKTNWQKFLDPEENPKVIYTDNWLEVGKACEDLRWNHYTFTCHRSETNGIAERAVRRVKEGTSIILLQFRLEEPSWADSMECYCCLRDVQDILSDGKNTVWTAIWRTFQWTDQKHNIEYHQISTKYQARLHQFGKKVFPGIFMGYALHAGRSWTGDILAADVDELQENDASEDYVKKINTKEVFVPKKEHFIFLCANGIVTLAGKGSEVRTSDQIQQNTEEGKEHRSDLHHGATDEPHSAKQRQEQDVPQAWHDFWSISGSFTHCHHVQERQKFYVPQERSFPVLHSSAMTLSGGHPQHWTFFAEKSNLWLLER